jgi:hypothetical protein
MDCLSTNSYEQWLFNIFMNEEPLKNNNFLTVDSIFSRITDVRVSVLIVLL